MTTQQHENFQSHIEKVLKNHGVTGLAGIYTIPDGTGFAINIVTAQSAGTLALTTATVAVEMVLRGLNTEMDTKINENDI